jgi:hypothetical protein
MFRHLLIAVASTGASIYGTWSILGIPLDDLGSVDYHASQGWGIPVMVVSPLLSLQAFVLIAYFSWKGFVEDWRLGRGQARSRRGKGDKLKWTPKIGTGPKS